jgi:hypothetical protein
MTFKEQLRRRLCGLYWSLRQGKPQGKIAIPRAGLRPQHLAVVLPPEFHDFDVALPILVPLIERMNPYHVTVLVRENFRTWIHSDWGLKLCCFDYAPENWLGFPKEPVRRKARDLEADVLVDLTPGFSPYTAGLSAATGAALRISLDTEEGNDFYNVFIALDEQKTLAERYDVLLRYV